MTLFKEENLGKFFILKPGINEELLEWIRIFGNKIEVLLEGKYDSRGAYNESLHLFLEEFVEILVSHGVGEVGGPSDLATGAVEGNDPYIKSIELSTDIALATFEFAHRVAPDTVESGKRCSVVRGAGLSS